MRARDMEALARYYRRPVTYASPSGLTVGIRTKRETMFFAWDKHAQQYRWSYSRPLDA